MGKVIPFGLGTLRDPVVVHTPTDGYQFVEKPAAKSSTAVLTTTPGDIACPKCGHFMTPADPKGVPYSQKGCTCKCHAR